MLLGAILGIIIMLLALLNVFQYGKVREQRAVNLYNAERIGAMGKGIEENKAALADKQKPTIITMTEPQVLGLASMIQSALVALHPQLTDPKNRPN